MYSQTKIAIPIFQEKCEDVIEVARDCIDKGADVLEFRIDALKNPDIREIKKHAVVYVVGAVILFGASGIVALIRTFAITNI